MANTALLCRTHHRLLHEGGWKMDWWGSGRPVFFSPRGDVIYEGRWEPPELGDDPVGALVEEHLHGGVQPDAWTASAIWKREEDIPDQVFFRALEAMEDAWPENGPS